MQIAHNAYAVVAYRLSDEAGVLLEDSQNGDPISYVHGYGMLVRGLEAGLEGLSVGDAKTIVVTPENGFGVRDEELVFSIAKSELPPTDKIEPGDFIVAEDEGGDEADLRVVSIHDEHVMVDGNHELAGMTLRFAVVVEDVRPATEEEKAAASSAFIEGESEAPPPHPELEEAMKDAFRGLAGKRHLPN